MTNVDCFGRPTHQDGRQMDKQTGRQKGNPFLWVIPAYASNTNRTRGKETRKETPGYS